MPLAGDERPIVPIAVVIPAYNMERYIGETLDTVFRQTVRPAEVIVVNDGSKDRTAEIAREKGAFVHDQENRGLPATRNVGTALASAPWIAFLDADDLWAPEKLERQWAAVLADSEAAGLVFTDFWQFDDDGSRKPSTVHGHRRFVELPRIEIAPGMWRYEANDLGDLLPWNCVMMPSALLIRKDVLLCVGGYDETLKYTEDIELELRVLTQTHALFVDVPLMGYRHSASNMTSNRLRMRSGDIDVAHRVLSSPSRYLPSTVAWFRREQPAIMFKGGRMAVAYGDQALARTWLAESWHARKQPSTLAWLLLSYLVDSRIGKQVTSSAVRTWLGFQARWSRSRAKQHRAFDR